MHLRTFVFQELEKRENFLENCRFCNKIRGSSKNWPKLLHLAKIVAFCAKRAPFLRKK